MEIFVVVVYPEASLGKVSQEAYKTLEEAQAFIESRSGNPRKRDEYTYKDEDYTYYCIEVVTVK